MEWTKNIEINRVKGHTVEKEYDILVVEYPLTIYLNQEEIITILCTPKDFKELGVGFLFSEGFLDDIDDLISIDVDKEQGVLCVQSKNIKSLTEKLQGKKTITSGSAKGTMAYNVIDSFKSKKIEEPLEIRVDDIKALVKEFSEKSEMFLSTGGVHSAALCTKDNIIIFAEDIGRHNALDKIIGSTILKGIEFKDKLVITSGRISSEMLIKVAKRGVPLIVSRSAPTSLSIELAKELNIAVVGFARGERMNIYSSFSNFKY